MARAQVLLRKCEGLQVAAVTCLHVTLGFPARATETAAHYIWNTARAKWNVFTHQKRVIIVYKYSKNRHPRHSNNMMVRFPDLKMSTPLLTYLCFVRALEQAIATEVTGSAPPSMERQQAPRVSARVRCSPEVSENADRSSAFASDHKGVTFSMYRNCCTAMVRMLTCADDTGALAVIEELELQSTNSMDTG